MVVKIKVVKTYKQMVFNAEKSVRERYGKRIKLAEKSVIGWAVEAIAV
jgi:hypothetical protein